ncbi:MAG TPA: M28 family peptidase, partial [Pirellulales bacterium]|nr:M28 family peptidase [Pirellulales bacterium]
MQRLLALLICAMTFAALDALASPLSVEAAAGETDQASPKKPMEKSYRGPLAELTPEQVRLRDALRADLEHLAGKIGERNLRRYPQLLAAADFLEKSLVKAGYRVARQGYDVHGRNCDNLEVEIRGRKQADEIVIVGAHYDSVEGAPGANDNGSG